MIAILFLGTLLGAMAIGTPIAFALIIAGAAMMAYLGTFDPNIAAQTIVNGANSFPLLAIPFFILAGEIMNAGGLSRRIVTLAMALIGHVRGGLGYVVIVTGVVMASLSGSASADAAALTALLLPMMIKAGYRPSTSGGLIGSASIIAPVIPPSIALIIFGVASNVSVTKLFLAGVAPGLMMGIVLALVWRFVAQNDAFTLPSRGSARETLDALLQAAWALLLPGIIIFGLRFGIFTPTEAGVVAAVYAIIVSTFVYREMTPAKLLDGFFNAAKLTSVVMFIVAASALPAWLIIISDLPSDIVDLLSPLADNPTMLVAMMMAVVLLVGSFMDVTPTILMLTPIFMPVVKMAGIDPAYFGVLFVFATSIGLLTPPVGGVLNVICGVSSIRMESLIKGVLPFLAAQFLLLVVFILLPSIITAPARWFF